MTQKFLHDSARARVGAEPACPIVPDVVVNRASLEFRGTQYLGVVENVFRTGYQLEITPNSREQGAAEISHPLLETRLFVSLDNIGEICARQSNFAFTDIPLKFIWIDWVPQLVSEPMYQELVANETEYTLVSDEDFCELQQVPVGQQFYLLSAERAYLQLEEYPLHASVRAVVWVNDHRMQCEILTYRDLELVPVLRLPLHPFLEKWPQLINCYQVLGKLRYAVQSGHFERRIDPRCYDKVGTRYLEKNERPQTYPVIAPVCEIQDFFKVLSDKTFLEDLIEFKIGMDFTISGAFVPRESDESIKNINETPHPKLRISSSVNQKIRMESPCASCFGIPNISSALSITQVQKRLQVIADNLYVGFPSHEQAIQACGAN